MIDNIPTIIKSIRGNIAKGFILRPNLILKKSFIVKNERLNLFAHGKTIKEAFKSLEIKIYANQSINEKLKEFKSKFNNHDKYTGHELSKWHTILTGSCAQGKENFIESRKIKLDQKYTLKEFKDICCNHYGWDIIKKL